MNKPDKPENISKRKAEHLKLCLTDDVQYDNKSNGFEYYDFIHCAITEVELSKINFERKLFGKKISYPFLISCMTGGTGKSENINAMLAESAEELKIPIGVGSQRQALESNSEMESFKVIRRKASSVPVFGNIGAAQLCNSNATNIVQKLLDMIQADVMVVHLNSLQELIQKNGQPNFKGLLNYLEKICKSISTPVIVKEVGAGISGKAAKKLLDVGVKGIDVAGAGGTSWAKVELLRNGNFNSPENNFFSNWGLPTSYCLRETAPLKKQYKFILVASGGINNYVDMSKAFALGADIAASARIILKQLDKNGTEGVVDLICNWFEGLKKIMYLTGSKNLNEFKRKKLIRKEMLY